MMDSLLSMINSGFWPFALSCSFAFAMAMFAIRRHAADLAMALQSVLAYGAWSIRGDILKTLIDGDLPPGTSDPHLVAAAIPPAILFAILAIVVIASYATAGSSVPKVEQKAEATKGVQSWLSDVASLVPTGAMAAFARIRAHVEELTRLSTQLPYALPAVSSAEVIVSRDLRNLLVAYKRVEVARRLLPGMANAGDKVLTDGMSRIESALVEMRKNVADEALKTLSVEGRFLELKHGDDDVEPKNFDA